MITFNYKSHEKIQLPDNKGEYDYKSKFLYNLVLRNDYNKVIDKLVIKVIFDKRVYLIKTRVENFDIKVSNSKHTSTLAIFFFKISQSINIDFLVANSDKSDKIELVSKTTSFRTKRSKFLTIKSLNIKKGRYWKKFKDWKIGTKISAFIFILAALLTIIVSAKQLFFSKPKTDHRTIENKAIDDSIKIQKPTE